MRTKDTDKKIFLLDAYALIFRAYYAFIKNPRVNSKGLNTSAIFGFLNSLLEILKNEDPQHIAVIFDPPGGSFRNKEYPAYKANRDETPEDIRSAVPWIKKIIEAFNIPVLMVDNYEADDVIGTLAKKAEKEGYTVYMMTPDKDFAQLVSDTVYMYRPGRGGNPAEIWGVEEIKEKFGVDHPHQIIDYLGMMGDAADNIPGLPGIGPKTASKFLKQFGSMENLFENTDKLKGKQKEKVEENKEQGLLSKHLATIVQDAPIEFEPDKLIMEEPNREELKKLFTELEFRGIARRVLGEDIEVPASMPKTTGSQISMFDLPQEEKETKSSVEEMDSFEPTKVNYQLVQTNEEIDALLSKLNASKSYAFDTETTSLDTIEAQLVGMSFAINSGEAYYVSYSDLDKMSTVLNRFKPLFEDPSKEIIGQNLKYDIKVLKKYGVKIKNQIFDTMLAHYLMSPDGQHGLNYLSEIYLNYKPISIESLLGKKGKSQKNMSALSPEKVVNYAAEDADLALRLKLIFEKEINKKHLKNLFENLEVPLIDVLADMELEGVKLDVNFLNNYSVELGEELQKLEKEIKDLAQIDFNVDSPKQLGEVLFDRLEISTKAKKTKTGQYSTGEDVLKKYLNDHPIIQKVLDYRQLKKLKSTYVDPLPNLVSPITNRLHTNYMQMVAATGRLSSNNPNLQNIPIRTDKGREIRKAFVPRDENHVLLSADYSQVELRVIASMSEDENMIEAFRSGADIHTATASKVFGVPMEEVTREMRSKAKAVNFGIIYGQGAFGLAQNLGIKRKEAKEIIDNYFEQFPKLKEFQQKTIQFARENGYVETIMGRRRYLKDINSNNAVVKNFAERNAINAPVQGSAADIIKKAMIDTKNDLVKQGLKSKMILQVHDELIFDVEKSEVEKIKALVIDKMENAVELKVPLKVDFGMGNNWLEAH